MGDITAKQCQIFTDSLKIWFSKNQRPLPWKGQKDPYLIWLSEIILQQTRVEQGLPYYNKFITAYPTVHDLAAAPDDEVMKMWEGLGYYSRARNLLATARFISKELKGVFPRTYKEVRALKGVGDYTAAAIVSFAYSLPHAVLDGNVYRVLSRYFGIHTPIDTTGGKKEFTELASRVLDKKIPEQHNQAIMDFGATHCKPKKPLCNSCLLKSSCHAFQQGEVNLLPIKSKKMKRKTRHFIYFCVKDPHHIYIRRREGKDIWKHLYEYPMLEVAEGTEISQNILQNSELWQQLFEGQTPVLENISPPYKQTLSHQTIIAKFVNVFISRELEAKKWGLLKIEPKKMENFAFPKIISCFLNDKTLYLRLD